ncbi:protein phosphatase inhibitor 2-like [Scaptodrosophila lebanonensis]|uniref:Protein phosphatase inhibitor 2-like n=1 Tax=Drosophila lebanonensis TaxID=7225 RepID=A0A6J2U7P2_DROLE|nr:protein phosphatase inhibitor 2-like [Scaptodrosophila lebanonensis]
MQRNQNEPSRTSILKNAYGVKAEPTISLKRAKFDEMNVLETLHPANKDYGHMVIDEPKTPFVFDDEPAHVLDTETLMEKLRRAAQSETPAFGMDNDSDDSSGDDDFPESLEEKVGRLEFERRRKLHYKEFLTVPLARRLIAEEFGDSELSIPDKLNTTSESCLSEVCAEHDNQDDQSGIETSSSYSSQSEPSESHFEPGFHPSHPCYHKLKAHIAAGKKKDKAEQPTQDVAQSVRAVGRPSGVGMSIGTTQPRPHSSIAESKGSVALTVKKRCISKKLSTS